MSSCNPTRKQPGSNPEAGFTLVEVMVALLITSTAVISLLGMREAAIEQTAQTRDSRVAWELATAAMGHVLTKEAPEWDDGPPSGVRWESEYPLQIAYSKGFTVTYGAVVEEIRISEDPDAEPEKIYKVVVDVYDEANPTPVRLVSYYPFGAKK